MGQSILIVCTSFPPEKGGAPTRIYNLACLLRDSGFEVTVITAMPNYPTGKIFPFYTGKLFVKEVVDGINVRRLWLFPSNSKNIVVRAASMMSYVFSQGIFLPYFLLKHKPDAVIVSSPPLLPAYIGMFCAPIFRRKTILNVSDIWPLSASELGAMQSGLLYRILQNTERKMYQMATAFTGQSIEILNHISFINKKNKKTFLYRNLQEQAATEAHRTGRIRKIIYAGNLGVAQGILEICQQINFAKLHTELHIYGDGLEKPTIENYIEQNPEHGIVLFQTIPLQEIPNLLSNYQLVLIPLKTAIHGAVPSKLFMAIANTLPVLFSGTGEGAEIVQQQQIGWTNKPGDYKTLEINIKNALATSEEDFSLMQSRIRLLTKTEFSKAKQDLAFINFLQEVIQ